jgi:hypothetical protein
LWTGRYLGFLVYLKRGLGDLRVSGTIQWGHRIDCVFGVC